MCINCQRFESNVLINKSRYLFVLYIWCRRSNVTIIFVGLIVSLSGKLHVTPIECLNQPVSESDTTTYHWQYYNHHILLVI